MNPFRNCVIIFISLSFLLAACGGQTSSNQKNNQPAAPDKSKLKIERVFLDPDTSRNCYTIISSTDAAPKGYIFLLPGFGETAQRVMEQTQLPLFLAQQGILTIIPTLEDGPLSFGIDPASQQSLKKIIADVRTKNQLTNQPFYLGGFSIGGSCVLKYAEEADQKPNAVFAIDPPLDFEKMHQCSKRNIRLQVKSPLLEESHFIIQRVEEIMGGTPEDALASYHAISPYSCSDTTQTAIKKLLETPVRIYTEPDVQWWMTERGSDYTSMNSTYHSAMINELHYLGNTQAELITTVNKGYREPEHTRHPHSWSIVDQEELIRWLVAH
jgi:hypothetical protein